MSTSAIAKYDPLPCALGGLMGTQTITPRPVILAPAAGLALPCLDNIQTRYYASDGTTRLEAVVSALLRAGAARTPAFQAHIEKGFPNVGDLADVLFRAWLKSLDPNDCSKHLTMDFVITDYSEQEYSARKPSDVILALQADANDCGGLRMNDVLQVLHRTNRALGSAFYRQFIEALNGMTCYYGEDDARGYSQRLRECYELDTPEDSEMSVEEYMADQGITLPNPDEARLPWLPSWSRISADVAQADREVLANAGTPLFQEWCDAVLELVRLSRQSGFRARSKRGHDELVNHVRDLWDDSRPLPPLVVYFENDDAIVQLFDEEQAHYYETSHEPDFLAVAHADKPAEIDRALRWFADYFRFQCVLMGLVRSIQAWQEQNEKEV